MESIILTTPVLLIIYIAILVICILNAALRFGSYIVPVITAFASSVFTALAVLWGASLKEIIIALTVLFIINLIPYRFKGGKK